MLARRRAGEPLAYVLGRWGFRHLDLAVDRRVLIPRPETEVVAGVAIELARAAAAAGHGRRPRHRLGRHRAVAGRRAARSTASRSGSPTRRRTPSTSPGPTSPASAGGPPTSASPRAAGSTPCPPTSCSTSPSPTRPTSPTGRRTSTSRCGRWEPHGALFAGPDGLDAIRAARRRRAGRVRPGGWLVLEIGADQGRAVERLLADARLRRRGDPARPGRPRPCRRRSSALSAAVVPRPRRSGLPGSAVVTGTGPSSAWAGDDGPVARRVRARRGRARRRHLLAAGDRRAAVAPVRPRPVLERLLRRPGPGALPRPPRRGAVRRRHRGLRRRRRDALLLRHRAGAGPAADQRVHPCPRRPPGRRQHDRRARRRLPRRGTALAAGPCCPRHRDRRSPVGRGSPACSRLRSGMASPLLWLSSRSLVYHEAELWGAALALLGFERVVAVVGEPADGGPGVGVRARPRWPCRRVARRASARRSPSAAWPWSLAWRREWRRSSGRRARRGRCRAAVRGRQRGPLRHAVLGAVRRPGAQRVLGAAAGGAGRQRRDAVRPEVPAHRGAGSTCDPTRSTPRALLPWLSWGGRADVVGDVTFDTVDRSASLPVDGARVRSSPPSPAWSRWFAGGRPACWPIVDGGGHRGGAADADHRLHRPALPRRLRAAARRRRQPRRAGRRRVGGDVGTAARGGSSPSPASSSPSGSWSTPGSPCSAATCTCCRPRPSGATSSPPSTRVHDALGGGRPPSVVEVARARAARRRRHGRHRRRLRRARAAASATSGSLLELRPGGSPADWSSTRIDAGTGRAAATAGRSVLEVDDGRAPAGLRRPVADRGLRHSRAPARSRSTSACSRSSRPSSSRSTARPALEAVPAAAGGRSSPDRMDVRRRGGAVLVAPARLG